MKHNQRAGVIAGSAHLALQGVSREQAGKYVCIASNVEGDGRSAPVSLHVICECFFIFHFFLCVALGKGFVDLYLQGCLFLFF